MAQLTWADGRETWYRVVGELTPGAGPTRVLILHGGADRVTPPEGSRKLAQQAGSQDKKLVIFEPALHSLLQEPEGPLVLAEIVGFVDARATRP